MKIVHYAYEDMKYHKITSIVFFFVTTLFMLAYTFISMLIWIQKEDFTQIKMRWDMLKELVSSINDDTFRVGETASSNLIKHYHSLQFTLIIGYLFVLFLILLIFLLSRKKEIQSLRFLSLNQFRIFFQLFLSLFLQLTISVIFSLSLFFLFQNIITDMATTSNRKEYITYFPTSKREIKEEIGKVQSKDDVSLPFNDISLFVSASPSYFSLQKIFNETFIAYFISIFAIIIIFTIVFFIDFNFK